MHIYAFQPTPAMPLSNRPQPIMHMLKILPIMLWSIMLNDMLILFQVNKNE